MKVIPVEYDQTARKRLGRAMRSARVDAGYKRREDFAAKIGRSGRQVQALENGESGVGPDTWAAAAAELGWPLENVYAILDGVEDAIPPSSSAALTAVSDEALVAEVLRRMKAGEGDGRDAASIGDAGPDLAVVTPSGRLQRVTVHFAGSGKTMNFLKAMQMLKSQAPDGYQVVTVEPGQIEGPAVDWDEFLASVVEDQAARPSTTD